MHELSGMMWWLALGISVCSVLYILAPLFKGASSTRRGADGQPALGPKPFSAKSYLQKKDELVAQYMAAQAAATGPDDPQWRQRRSELEASYYELYQAYQQHAVPE